MAYHIRKFIKKMRKAWFKKIYKQLEEVEISKKIRHLQKCFRRFLEYKKEIAKNKGAVVNFFQYLNSK